MALDVDETEDQRSLRQVLDAFGAAHEAAWADSASQFPKGTWEELADLGILAMARPSAGGGPEQLVSAMAALGRWGCPGPLAATVLATCVLPDEEADAVGRGELLASVRSGGLWPWALEAGVLLTVEHDLVTRWRPSGSVEVVQMLGGEPWGRIAVYPEVSPIHAAEGAALYDLALASYLVGGAQQVVSGAADYARSRQQFGRPIGDFQGVAFPLADAHTRVAAATDLAYRAAADLAAGREGGRDAAAAARISAGRAGHLAVRVGRQVAGAMGYTQEWEFAARVARIGLVATTALERGNRLLSVHGDGGGR